MIFNRKTGEFKVRVRGVDKLIRDMARLDESVHKSAKRGVLEAAEYLKDVIQEKFGTYQESGGINNGAWQKLKPDTVWRKRKKGIKGDKPLIESGKMKNSFYTKSATTLEGIAASVGSDDPKIVHHVYGAPSINLPPRDMILVTAVEEKDMCHDIIMDAVNSAVDKLG